MKSEKEIRERLEKLRILENTPREHLRIQRYHEIKALEWVLYSTTILVTLDGDKND